MTKPITPPFNKTEYINALINQPWAQNGRHCWRLVREVQRDLYGRELPLVMDIAPVGIGRRHMKDDLFRNHPERENWIEAKAPIDGAVVFMSRNGSRLIDHAGVYIAIDRGGILHTDDPHGVVFDSERELAIRCWVPLYLVPKET